MTIVGNFWIVLQLIYLVLYKSHQKFPIESVVLAQMATVMPLSRDRAKITEVPPGGAQTNALIRKRYSVMGLPSVFHPTTPHN